LLLGFMVEYGPPVADGVVPGDARHVILQRRPGPDKGGPGELSSPYTGPGGFCGLGTGKVLGGETAWIYQCWGHDATTTGTAVAQREPAVV
ncbi:hypothetical protein PV325_008891, partial [Microctonus aethiopoides]